MSDSAIIGYGLPCSAHLIAAVVRCKSNAPTVSAAARLRDVIELNAAGVDRRCVVLHAAADGRAGRAVVYEHVSHAVHVVAHKVVGSGGEGHEVPVATDGGESA